MCYEIHCVKCIIIKPTPWRFYSQVKPKLKGQFSNIYYRISEQQSFTHNCNQKWQFTLNFHVMSPKTYMTKLQSGHKLTCLNYTVNV